MGASQLNFLFKSKEQNEKVTDEIINKWTKTESYLNYPSEQVKRIIFRAGLSLGAKAMRDGKICIKRKS